MIKLIEHKHTYFSGFRIYITGNAGYKNQSEILKFNLNLALDYLDEKSTQDKIWSYNKYLDKYSDFSFNLRKFIQKKYLKKTNKKMGNYLWIKNINNKSYVGKSVDLFKRLNKIYIYNYYIFKNKEKWLFVSYTTVVQQLYNSAIYKYGIDKIYFYILFII
jgi:hypothetical protein